MTDLMFCGVCRESIQVGATKCPHCDSFQSWVKRFALYSATIVGLISLAGTFFSLSYEITREEISRKDPLKIIEYEYKRGAVFLNKSPDSLYLENVLILGNGRKSMFTESLNMVLEPGEIYSHINPGMIYAIHSDSLPRSEWEQVWISRHSCLNVFFDTENIEHAERTANATLSYVSGNDGEIRRLGFEVGVFAIAVSDGCMDSKYGHQNSLFK